MNNLEGRMMRKLSHCILTLLIGIPLLGTSGQAQDAEAKRILQRAIAAVGGESRLNALKGPMMWMQRGTFYGMGDGVPFVAQYSSKWPHWYREEIEAAFTITVSGEQAWVTSSGVRKLSGADRKERIERARLAWAERLFPLTDKAYQLSTIDGILVDGRPTVGIKAKREDGRDIKLFFDKQSYLIAKVETMVISPQHGPDPVLSEAFYTDHKSFGGIMMPSKLKLNYDKKLFVEGETVDYKMGATLDPKLFELPE